jgi:hypothetical protein
LDHSLSWFACDACVPVETPRASARLKEIAYLLVFMLLVILPWQCAVLVLKLLTTRNVQSNKDAMCFAF